MKNELEKIRYTRRHTLEFLAGATAAVCTKNIWGGVFKRRRKKNGGTTNKISKVLPKGIEPYKSPLIGGQEAFIKRIKLTGNIFKKYNKPLKNVVVDIYQAGPILKNGDKEALIHSYTLTDINGAFSFETYIPRSIFNRNNREFNGYLIRLNKVGYRPKLIRLHLDSNSESKYIQHPILGNEDCEDIILTNKNSNEVEFSGIMAPLLS